MIEILALALALAQPVEPEAVSSAYSQLDRCVEIDGPAPVNERCEGYGDWTVFIGASDHSAGLAYSQRARDEQMAQRPVSGGLFQSFARVIEWRVRDEAGGWTPFATIHRWTAATPVFDDAAGDFTGAVDTVAEVLTVTALRPEGPIGACHIAYVDAREVYDANLVARAAADLDAPLFRCGEDAPVRIGAGEAVRLMERAGLPY